MAPQLQGTNGLRTPEQDRIIKLSKIYGAIEGHEECIFLERNGTNARVKFEKVIRLGDVLEYIQKSKSKDNCYRCGSDIFVFGECGGCMGTGNRDTKFISEVENYIIGTMNKWEKLHNPINDQSMKCIDYIYSLIN